MLPLPLFSTGGSSLLASFLGLGIALGLAARGARQLAARHEGLVERGMAYRTPDGSVYFSIEKYQGCGCRYGQLVKLNFEGMRSGERVSSDEYEKESLADFALWKARVPEDGDVFWPSPWGEGRPGWHVLFVVPTADRAEWLRRTARGSGAAESSAWVTTLDELRRRGLGARLAPVRGPSAVPMVLGGLGAGPSPLAGPAVGSRRWLELLGSGGAEANGGPPRLGNLTPVVAE